MAYELEVEGKIVDQATKELPFDYIQGTHMLIPMLEAEIEGKEEGDRFECVVPPEEGYGEYSLHLVFDIPKSSFMMDGKLREDLLQVGKYIPMLNQRGEVCNGMIVEIKEEQVTMDFNPPMAGKTMHFTGEIISVREATEKELTEGLHGEYLPQEGGCHCGGHCKGHHGEGGCCHGDGEVHEGGCCHGEGEGHEGGCCHGHCNHED